LRAACFCRALLPPRAARTAPQHVPVHRPLDLSAYETSVRESWVGDELYKARNVRPAFAWGGLWGGIAYSAVDTYLLRGKAPWTFKHS
jgi:electron-transferring-flavoprotein dehydrogenase